MAYFIVGYKDQKSFTYGPFTSRKHLQSNLRHEKITKAMEENDHCFCIKAKSLKECFKALDNFEKHFVHIYKAKTMLPK